MTSTTQNPSKDYDLFVIGAGSGGVRAARMAAGMGARVAIAEDRYMGGTCVNVGCVPKKLYVYASEFSKSFEDARGFGWDSQIPDFDWSTLRDNKKNEISRKRSRVGKLEAFISKIFRINQLKTSSRNNSQMVAITLDKIYNVGSGNK